MIYTRIILSIYYYFLAKYKPIRDPNNNPSLYSRGAGKIIYLTLVYTFNSRYKDYILGKEDRIENPLILGEETY